MSVTAPPNPTEQPSGTDDHLLNDLAQRVMAADFAAGAYLIYQDGGFEHFVGTRWMPMSNEELGRMILPRLRGQNSRLHRRPHLLVGDVINMLKLESARTMRPGQNGHDDPLPIVNCRNAELWVGDDGSVDPRPHSPGSGQRHCLPVDYDPAALCPLYDDAVAEIFSPSPDKLALEELWDELIGYTLQPKRPRPLIIIGHGRGRDGKSALAGLLVNLLGPELVAAMPVEDLVGSQFVMADLIGKRLLLDDDLQAGVILPDGVLKKLSTAALTRAERKNRSSQFFKAMAVPLLLGNTIPTVRDRSQGFRRRLVVIPFDRALSEAEADYGLFPRIQASELSGVLNRALRGLQRVIQRGWKFELPPAVLRATDDWLAVATAGNEQKPPLASRSATTVAPTPVTSPPPPSTAFVSAEGEHHSPQSAGRSRNETNVEIFVPDCAGDCDVTVEAGGHVIKVRTASRPTSVIDLERDESAIDGRRSARA